MAEDQVARLSPFLLLALLILSFSYGTLSLKVTSSSPCQPLCDNSLFDTTADDIVCLDSQYDSTANGSYFKSCVECELGSNAVEPSSGATDVTWGLYNLRYAFSTCIFGFPIEKVSVSTPCQVSCTQLEDAILYDLKANTTAEDLSFCDLPSFRDTAGINRCAECYGRMEGQAYMANFLQALHIACLDPPRPPETFPVIADHIFSSAAIPTPTPTSADRPSSVKSANLALVVALPVVFVVIIITSVAVCCFYSARRRRRIMAARNNMRAIHDKASTTFAPHGHHDYHLGQIRSPMAGYQSPPSAHPSYYSPYTDSKEIPYPQLQSPARVIAPAAQHQPTVPSSQHFFPEPTQPSYHRPYSPADYATGLHNSTQQRPPETSDNGPQSEVHSLHDQHFPLPPPPSCRPPAAPSSRMSMPIVLAPPRPQSYQGVVEPLSQHDKKIPSLIQPVPKGKKKALQARQQQQQQTSEGSGVGVQVQDYGMSRDVGDEKIENSDNGPGRLPISRSAPQVGDCSSSTVQVLSYDPVAGRYVKQSQAGPA